MDLTLAQKLHKDRDSILRFCSRHDRIRLFGSGDPAILMFRYLTDEQIDVADFIMTDEDAAQTGSVWFDKPVVPLSEAHFRPEDGIFITSEAWMQGFVVQKLRAMGVLPAQIYQQGIYGQYTEMESDLSSVRTGYTGNDAPEGYFAGYTALDAIGTQTGTDKAHGTHNYLNKYEHFLLPWKDRSFTLLELGIFDGASLRMWEQYFPQAHIVGVDFDERCAQMGGGRKEVVIADLSLLSTLESLKKYKPEIIIDDASHIWSHQIKSLVTLFPVLPHGGVFILEDLETSFSAYRFQNYNDAPVSAYDFCRLIATVVTGGEVLDTRALQPEAALLAPEIEAVASETELVSFIKGSCILIKK